MSGSSHRRPIGDALVGSGLDVACAWAQLPGSVSLRRRERAKRKGTGGKQSGCIVRHQAEWRYEAR